MARANAGNNVAVEDIPPGWTYNPSSWRERWPLLCLAAVGLGAALYTALSQLGLLAPMWDPFFGSASSYSVTHSHISQLLPVPDGLLGVVGYVCDLVFGTLGGRCRWRTQPWVALAFAVVISVLALVSLALTILQGTVIGHWCSVCLVSAAASTLIFGLGIGEALATLQELTRIRARRGWHSAWHALWRHDESKNARRVGAPLEPGNEQTTLDGVVAAD